MFAVVDVAFRGVTPFPTDLSYFWTPKVLFCRSQSTSRDFYDSVLRLLHGVTENEGSNQSKDTVPESRNERPYSFDPEPIAFIMPDPSAPLFVDVPQVANSAASTYWSAVLLTCCEALDDYHVECTLAEAESFQRSCLSRKIEKVFLLLCESSWTESQRKHAQRFCDSHGIEISFLSTQATCERVLVGDNPFLVPRLTAFKKICRRDALKRISVMLESGSIDTEPWRGKDAGQRTSLPESTTAAATQKLKADLKLRKQQADCELLLGDEQSALTKYFALLESTKQGGDHAFQALCCECIAACLVHYYELHWNGERKAVPDSEGTAGIAGSGSTSPMADQGSPTQRQPSLPPVLDNLVREALAPKRGGASYLQQLFVDRVSAPSALSSALQDFIQTVNIDPSGHAERLRTIEWSARRTSINSVSANSNMVLIVAAVAKLREAVGLYRKAGASCELSALVTSLSVCSLLITVNERASALDAITAVVDEALDATFHPAILHVVITGAACCWMLRAPRKFAYILHQLNAKLSELAASPVNKSSELWRALHRGSLMLAPWLALPASTFVGIPGDLFLRLQPAPQITCRGTGDEGLSLMQALLASLRVNAKVAAEYSAASHHLLFLASEELSDDSRSFLGWHTELAHNSANNEPCPLRDWPAVQATTLERLRRAAENLHLSSHVLWYAYAALLILFGALDPRSQTASMRTVAAREMAYGQTARLAFLTSGKNAKEQVSPQSTSEELEQSIGPQNDVSESRDDTKSASLPIKHTVPWLVPPAVTIISLDKDACYTYKEIKALGPLSYTSSRRRLKHFNSREENAGRSSSGKLFRLTTFGGLGNGMYVPVLSAIEAKEERRCAATGVPTLQSVGKKLRSTICQTHSRVIPYGKPADEGAPLSAEASPDFEFLYRPFGQKESENRLPSRETYWAMGDLHTVTVYVRNPLGTEMLLDNCRLLVAGVSAENQPLTVGLAAGDEDDVKIETIIIPREVGTLFVVGFAYSFCRVATTQFLLWDTPELATAIFGDENSGPQLNDFDGLILPENRVREVLMSSAVSQIVIVPPMPALEIRQHMRQRLYPQDPTPEVNLLFGQPKKPVRDLLYGECVQFEITLQNTSTQPIVELQIFVDSANPDIAVQPAPNSKAGGLSISCDGGLSHFIRAWRLDTGEELSITEEDGKRLQIPSATASSQSTTTIIPAGGDLPLVLETLAFPGKGLPIGMTLVYCGAGSFYKREDHLLIDSAVRPGAVFFPRGISVFETPPLDVEGILGAVCHHEGYSEELRHGFLSLLYGTSAIPEGAIEPDFRSSLDAELSDDDSPTPSREFPKVAPKVEFDGEDVMLCLDLSSSCDLGLACYAEPCSDSIKVLYRQHLTLDAGAPHTKWLLGIQRLAQCPERGAKSIPQLLDSLIRLKWSVDVGTPAHGRLLFSDTDLSDSMSPDTVFRLLKNSAWRLEISMQPTETSQSQLDEDCDIKVSLLTLDVVANDLLEVPAGARAFVFPHMPAEPVPFLPGGAEDSHLANGVLCAGSLEACLEDPITLVPNQRYNLLTASVVPMLAGKVRVAAGLYLPSEATFWWHFRTEVF